MPISTQCIDCYHYLGDNKCDAFPKDIPYRIRSGQHDHREPFDNDNGIRFESLEKKLEENRKLLNKVR